MERDGSLKSLWQEGHSNYIPNNVSDQGKTYDVVIAGGGITGITTGLLLQKAGKSCLLIEARNIGFGTTGGTTAHLNTLLDNPYTTYIKNFGEENARLVAKGAAQAISLVEKHVLEYKIHCGFERKSAYLIAKNEKQKKELEDIETACRKVGLKIAGAKQIPAPIAFTKAIKVDDQAQFHPVDYIYAIAKEFENLGGAIRENCRVLEAENEDDLIEVKTTDGVFKCKNLVYATHIPPGINILDLKAAPYRSYAMAVRLKSGNYPDCLIYDLDQPFHYYRTQNVNGRDYLIAGGCDHKTGHKPNTNKPFLTLESDIKAVFDVEEVAFRWSSQYYEPVDALPYIGLLPGFSKNIYVATGFSGNGMTFGSLAAIIFKELIADGESEYRKLFHPGRIKPIAGFAEFVKENADVTAKLFQTVLPKERLEELAGLAPGEGSVVKFEDKTIAIHKDENGKIYALNPNCTHLGCEVSFNIAERSWDCPCHGTRYDVTGRILTAPATKPLESLGSETEDKQ